MANFLTLTIRSLLRVYDLVTYPLYWLIQKPWRVKDKRANDETILWEMVDNRTFKFRCISKADRPWEEKPDATIPSLMDSWSVKFADRPCMGSRKVLGHQEGTFNGSPVKKVSKSATAEFKTFSQVSNCTHYIANYLIGTMGIQHGDFVLIFSATRMEFSLAAHGSWRAGCSIVTQLPIVSLDMLEETLSQTEPKVIFTDSECLKKIQELLQRNLPFLNRNKVICFDNYSGWEDIKTFDQVLKMGNGMPDQHGKVGPDDLALIMFTGGTGGKAKGVRFTHRTLVSATVNLISVSGRFMPVPDKHGFLEFLPQSHIFDLMQEMSCLAAGCPISYGSPYTLTENSPQTVEGELGDLAVFKPAYIIAVPLVVNRIKLAIEAKVAAKGKTFERLFHSLVEYKQQWTEQGFATPILDMLVFKRIASAFGGNLNAVAVAGAAVSPESQAFFRSVMCCTVIQGYGTTEISSAGTAQSSATNNVSDVGLPNKNVTFMIKSWEEGGYFVNDPNGPSGELIVGGESVADGYFKLEDRGSFYQENGQSWYITGDIVQLDLKLKSLKIIDRKNQVVKMPNGENVSLGTIENTLGKSKFVDLACAVVRPYKKSIVAVVVPDEKSLSKLAEHNVDSAQRYHVGFGSDQDELKPMLGTLSSHLLAQLKTEFDGILKGPEMPGAIVIAQGPWTPESGLVTGAMKVKRPAVERAFASQLDHEFELLD